MARLATGPDRSREGCLVHDAWSSGRDVTIVVYIEGLGPGPRYLREVYFSSRTAEQAAEIARVLREARFGGDHG